jgi:protein SCO1
MKNISILLFLAALSIGCMNNSVKKLPILGRHEFIETDTGTDTVYHKIKPFSFVDQDSSVINNETFSGKIYVADFFFTSCPSICPIMKAQMLRVYNNFNTNDKVLLLSHTIDPEYDNVSLLHSYANKLDVKSSKWHFVTGDKSTIYDMAQTSYYVATRENEKAPGGYEHSGAFILVDNQRRIRGVYDGTKVEAVDKLIKDISTLLSEVND